MSVSATEIADFFKQNPDFLVNNPGVLAFVHLPTHSAGNVSSLQERQVQTMRDKVKSLEHRIASMSLAAVENQTIIDNLLTFQRELLRTRNVQDLPEVLVNLLSKLFNVPMVQLRIWGDDSLDSSNLYKMEVSEAALAQLEGMQVPYCGFSESAPALEMFDAEEVKPRSVVIMPLRVGMGPTVFGCLALGSPDKDRFSPDLETDFLSSLSETACAALTRLT